MKNRDYFKGKNLKDTLPHHDTTEPVINVVPLHSSNVWTGEAGTYRPKHEAKILKEIWAERDKALNRIDTYESHDEQELTERETLGLIGLVIFGLILCFGALFGIVEAIKYAVKHWPFES